jgi:hypothetical protein
MQHISLDRTSRITTYKEFFCTKERGCGYLDAVITVHCTCMYVVNTEHARKNLNKRLKEGKRITNLLIFQKQIDNGLRKRKKKKCKNDKILKD